MRQLAEPLSLAIVLTVLAAIVAGLFMHAPMPQVLAAWGRGLGTLQGFTMQVVLLIIFSAALAYTRPIAALIHRAARLPRAPGVAYVAVVIMAACASFFSGATGLVVGALAACAIAAAASERNMAIDFPLLVAGAYSGFVIWHGGLAGTAPLFVATEGHSMTEFTGGVIPLTDTVLSARNMVTNLAVVTALCACVLYQQPGRLFGHRAMTLADAESIAAFINERYQTQRADTVAPLGMRILNMALGLSAIGWVAQHVLAGDRFDFQTLIILCFGLGIMLADTPSNYMALCQKSMRSVLPVIILYPLYGGIMEVCATSGIVEALSARLASASTPETLPILTFFSAGLINLFIPSGGGQWILQGPVILDAAQAQGVDPKYIVLAFAYGDQWTNLVQPFWAIPLLSICDLEIGAVFRYLCLLFLASGAVFATALLTI